MPSLKRPSARSLCTFVYERFWSFDLRQADVTATPELSNSQ